MRHLLIAFVAASAFAQQPDDAIFKVRTFHEVAISPDGKRVAWSERDHGIWSSDADGAHRRQLTTGDDDGLAWSPSSTSLVYIGKKQLFVDGKQLTKVSGNVAEPRWSPDGKSIAFLFIENAKRAAGPLVAMSRAIGVIEEKIDEQRIAVVEVATKKIRIVTPADMYVYHFDWAPDSKHMAAEAAPGSGDNNYWIAQLHVVDVDAATMKPIYKPQLQIANPKWSPDGSQIAFIEGIMSDEGSTGGDLFVIPAAGGDRRDVTPNIQASVTTFEWLSPESILLGENAQGESAIVRMRTTDGAAQVLWKGWSVARATSLVGAT